MFFKTRLCSALDIELGLLKFMLVLQVSVFRLLLVGALSLRIAAAF